MTHAQAHEGEAPDGDDPGAGAASTSTRVGPAPQAASTSVAVSSPDAAANSAQDTAEPALAARLDAWRARQSAGADPLSAAFIDTLARRAEAQQGAVRRLLEARLSTLLGAYEARAGTSHAAQATH
ncbi:MAG: DUF2894 domain-containing protein, partial [Comamonadaceae bacterium]